MVKVMASANDKYWQRREKAERDYIKGLLADDEAFNKTIEAHYKKAIDDISKEITAQYANYANAGKYTMKEAIKQVSAEDIKQYQSQAKAIVKAAQKRSPKAFSDEINRHLKLYNATMRINRLELLKSRAGLELVNAGIAINSDLAAKLTTDYQNEIRRQAGILGEDIPTDLNNSKTLFKKVIAQTQSANFSQRVWGNVDALKAQLDTTLVNMSLQGTNPRDAARQLRTQIGASYTHATFATERIARTESARLQTQAQLDSFKAYGYD